MFGFVVCAMCVGHEANQFKKYSRLLSTEWLPVSESLLKLGMGTNLVTNAHGRSNLEWGQIMLQAAMGEGTWNGDKSGCGRPCAMELDMGTHQIAGGHGRRNLEWGQIKLQAAMGDGTGNGDTSHCKRPSAMDPGIGANQIAGGHGPWAMEPGMGTP